MQARGPHHKVPMRFLQIRATASDSIVAPPDFRVGDVRPPEARPISIRVKEGQRLYLNLTNVGMIMRPDLFDPHTVHFHGFPQAAAIFDGVPDASVAINMGSTFTYYYNLVEPGTYMYHCHVEATEHMQMGMFANLYVTPKQNGTLYTYQGHPYTQFVYNDGDGSTGYDVEYPVQLSGFDPDFHDADLLVQPLPFYTLYDRYGMLNGRGYPQTTNPGVLTPPAENGGKPSQKVSTLIEVNQGDTISVSLSSELPVPVSIIFPGQEGVTALPVSGSPTQGLLTLEANSTSTVQYTFTANHPGTFQYHSGTRPDLEVEMGLVGALIVRPTDGGGDVIPMQAYGHVDSMYDVEYLFLLTEMDPVIHMDVEEGRLASVDTSDFFAGYWFINGRCAPDTMAPPNASWLPTQPHNCMPMMMPGQKLLMRVIDGGRDGHPFHFHGNNATVIAEDGRLLSSAPGAGADIAYSLFTVQAAPGKTADLIFEWTGAQLGWDIYGHHPGDPMEPNEYAPDHGKPFPVVLPDTLNLTLGIMYSGSPFLGAAGYLPPGEGGLNPNAGYAYMWHSHNEKEMTNFNIFPGGMMTMLMIEPPGAMPMP